MVRFLNNDYIIVCSLIPHIPNLILMSITIGEGNKVIIILILKSSNKLQSTKVLKVLYIVQSLIAEG